MYEELKTEISTILEIVDKCPVDLKQQCFDILLHSFIEDSKKVKTKTHDNVVMNTIEQERLPIPQAISGSASEDVKLNMFHTAVRRMLEANSITIEDLNKLYYQEGNVIKPLYEHMKTTLTSDSQIRLALLTAFENGYSNNELVADVENVRDRCKAFKCYDGGNFTAIFKRSKSFFDGLEESSMKTFKLSVEGKKELCIVLRDMAKGE